MKICARCNFSNDDYQGVCSNCGSILDSFNGNSMYTGRTNNGTATAALVLGILSMVSCGCLAGIPAIICGRIAKNQIRESNGMQEGEGFATAGFILGIISTSIWLIVGIIYLVIIILAAYFGDSNSTYSFL